MCPLSTLLEGNAAPSQRRRSASAWRDRRLRSTTSSTPTTCRRCCAAGARTPRGGAPASTTSPGKPPRARLPSKTLPCCGRSRPSPCCWSGRRRHELLGHVHIARTATDIAVRSAAARTTPRTRATRGGPWTTRSCKAVRMAFDAPDLHQQRRTGAARATCARLGRGGRWFNGNEGCKYFSFNHFIPESIVPSSPSALLSGSVSTSIAAAQIQVQLASLAPLRRAAPTPPHRTRIAALFRPCSACARRRGQQRASGKQRTLSTSSWPWFVHARAPPRRGREEPEAHNRAAGG